MDGSWNDFGTTNLVVPQTVLGRRIRTVRGCRRDPNERATESEKFALRNERLLGTFHHLVRSTHTDAIDSR